MQAHIWAQSRFCPQPTLLPPLLVPFTLECCQATAPTQNCHHFTAQPSSLKHFSPTLRLFKSKLIFGVTFPSFHMSCSYLWESGSPSRLWHICIISTISWHFLFLTTCISQNELPMGSRKLKRSWKPIFNYLINSSKTIFQNIQQSNNTQI